MVEREVWRGKSWLTVTTVVEASILELVKDGSGRMVCVNGIVVYTTAIYPDCCLCQPVLPGPCSQLKPCTNRAICQIQITPVILCLAGVERSRHIAGASSLLFSRTWFPERSGVVGAGVAARVRPNSGAWSWLTCVSCWERKQFRESGPERPMTVDHLPSGFTSQQNGNSPDDHRDDHLEAMRGVWVSREHPL